MFLNSRAILGACAFAALAAHGALANPLDNLGPVTDEMLSAPAAEDWLMFRGTYDGHGHSPLDQISAENVAGLEMVWSRGLQAGAQESTPIVHDGVMFLGQTPDMIQALDATTGDLLWGYKRELAGACTIFTAGCAADGEAVPVVATRNMAISGDRLIHLTQDNYIIALDTKSGQMIWETQVRTSDNWGWQTGGPIIANGLAISGRSCGARNVAGDSTGCFIAAHSIETGEEVWRFNTIPQEGEAGYESWHGVPDEARRHIGTWMPPTYDAELNLVYFGTSVTSPFQKFSMVDPEFIDGEFLYQTSTLAIDATTGELVWYQQHIRDHWDLDHTFTRLLVDTVVAPDADAVRWINPAVTPGEERKVLTGIPGKTGIVYSIDRATGEFLWATESMYQNTVVDIDTTTGRATMNPDLIPTEPGQRMVVCPGYFGGADWALPAYSPATNAMYYPLQNLCSNGLTEGSDVIGTVHSIDAETGVTNWIAETGAYTGSLLSTGGGLIFGGDLDRRFRALSAESGEVLWETILPTAIGGTPVTYAIGGKQYVAVVAAPPFTLPYISANAGAIYPDAGGNAMFVFALPE